MTRASHSLSRLADACLSTSCLTSLTSLTVLTVLAGLGATGCGGASAVAPMARAADNTPSKEATLVQFETTSNETWSVRRENGSVVCRLPCRYWVRPESNLSVQLDRYDKAEYKNTSYFVPAYLPANEGEVAYVRVDRTHGLGNMGKYAGAVLGSIFGFSGAGLFGIGVASLATGSKNISTSIGVSAGANVDTEEASAGVNTEAQTNTTDVAASIGGMALGAAALGIAVASWVWFAHDREGVMKIEVGPANPAPPPRARLRLVPGGVAVETEGTRGVVTPGGAYFTF